MIGFNKEWSPTHKLKCPRWSPTDRCREQKNREEFCQKAVKIIRNLRKPLVFFGCGNKSCPGINFFFENRKKIDLRRRQGEFGSQTLGSRRRVKSSLAMPRPRTAGDAAEGTFLWKRSTLESSGGGFVKSCSAKVIKSKLFRGQEAHFEECTFTKSRACRPQTKKSRSRKLQIATHEFSLGASDI